MIYFSLSSHIYAAAYENAIILLDSNNDNYLSLIDDAAGCLRFTLENPFIFKDQKYVPKVSHKKVDELNEWIAYFLENQFICINSQTRKILANGPLKSGGLAEYQWDYKNSWKPFACAYKREVMQAFFKLAKVHYSLKRHGVKEILEGIKNNSIKTTYNPTEQEISQLAAAVDAASLIYPKKTLCLAWAATFALLALKKQWHIHFAIGIQANPFYAHAWVETKDGKVINDNPVIAQVLSIIFKEPR